MAHSYRNIAGRDSTHEAFDELAHGKRGKIETGSNHLNFSTSKIGTSRSNTNQRAKTNNFGLVDLYGYDYT